MSEKNESFRDSIGTVEKDGKRHWIYPKRPVGKFYNWRSYASWVYLAVFAVLPWIKMNGHPLFLFNIFERKFILFGKIFWPQDFFLFVLGMLTFMVFIVLFTVVFGRLFCGWVCPQTIFMEMVFRKIEYWIEGDGEKQKRLDAQPWDTEKIMKRGGKILAFISISFLIAHYFMSYLIGMDNVILYISEGITKHIAAFAPLVIFTAIFSFVYLWFREQACIIVCPYGRLQGVLLDKHSIVVAYDYLRGEKRARFNRHEERTAGDCVDCGDCVKVCPTGIDIRNGTQMECVACTACIDACDLVMEKFNFEKGLIRYASETNIAQKEKWTFTPRIMAYSAVLTVLIGVLTVLLFSRKEISTTIMRAQGQLYQMQGKDTVSNLYNIKLVNKTYNDFQLHLKVLSSNSANIKMVGKDLEVMKESIGDGVFFVQIPKNELTKRKTQVEIGVFAGDKMIDKVKTNFMAPVY